MIVCFFLSSTRNGEIKLYIYSRGCYDETAPVEFQQTASRKCYEIVANFNVNVTCYENATRKLATSLDLLYKEVTYMSQSNSSV